jgi:hypothetical protein
MRENYSIGFVCGSAAWGGLEMNVLRLAGGLTVAVMALFILFALRRDRAADGGDTSGTASVS